MTTMKNTKKILVTIITLILLIANYNVALCQEENQDVFIKNGSRKEKLIALTFDDGPHPKETNEILDILDRYNVKATFFVVGKHCNWYSKPLVRAAKEGHEIGNHTFTHPDISSLSCSDIKKEIKDCEDIVYKIAGVRPTLFRPPFGSYNQKELGQVAKDCGYKIVLWTTVDAKDWENPPPSEISSIIINKAINGDIILLHDYGTENTVKALDVIIPTMIKNGYKFVTVSELIK